MSMSPRSLSPRPGKLKDKSSQQIIDSAELPKVIDDLNEDELNELALFLSDLDGGASTIPPSERTHYHVEKEATPTEDFDRTKLLNFIDKQASQVPPREHYEPFTGEKKGKAWRPKKEVRKYDMKSGGDQTEKTGVTKEDWELVIDGATEDDLVDLAALLGFGNMVSQEQYQAAQEIIAQDKKERSKNDPESSKDDIYNVGSLKKGEVPASVTGQIPKGLTKFSLPAQLGKEINTTDVDSVIKRAMDNDASLTEINFNNIKNISKEKFMNLFNALRTNRTAKKVFLANTRMEDCIGFALADLLEENNVIEDLNIESNYLTGEGGLLRILEAVEMNTTLKELRLSNQYTTAGQHCEMRMAEMLETNRTLLKFGYNFDTQGPRNKATSCIQRNIEISRRIRKGEVDQSARQPVPSESKDERYKLQQARKKEKMEEIRRRMIEAEQREAEKGAASGGAPGGRLSGVVPRWERLGIPDPRIPVAAETLDEEFNALNDEDGGAGDNQREDRDDNQEEPDEEEEEESEGDDDDDDDDEDEDDDDDGII